MMEEKEDDLLDLEVSIHELQQTVLSNWNKPSELAASYQGVGQALQGVVEQATQNRRSGSVLFYGPAADVHTIVDGVIGLDHDSVAYVNCEMLANEQDALLEVIDTFIWNRPQRHLQPGLEDLEDYFAGCYHQQQPAIVYLENFQALSSSSRRPTVLYTLLDLMHTPQRLFVLILHSCSADICNLLEKRVLSRLNAQVLYSGGLQTAEALAVDLLHLMTGGLPAADSSNIATVYREALRICLGEQASTSDGVPQEAGQRAPQSSGLTAGLFQRYIDVGNTRQDFQRTALTVLSGLGRLPFGSADALARALAASFALALEKEQPITLSEALLSLCAHEFTLYVAMARLRCQQHVTAHAKEILVDDVLKAFDAITELLSNKGLSMQRVAHWFQKLAHMGLICLWTGQKGQAIPLSAIPSMIEPGTIITMMHSAEEIRIAFQLPQDRPAHCRIWREVQPMPGLVLPDKLRNAVLMPMQPLLFGSRMHSASVPELV